VISIKNKVTRLRNVVQLLWLIFFGNGLLFGLPAFGTNPALRYVFIPNLTTKYLIYSPSHCYFFELQSALQTGYSVYYLNIVLPLLIVIILLLLFARFWCGWLCPFGFVQDLLQELRRLLRLPYKVLSYPTVRILDKTKFAILFIVIVIVVLLGLPDYGLGAYQSIIKSPFEQVCPARPLFVYVQQIIGWEPWSTGIPPLSIAALAFFFGASFVVRKFWCRICPVGAINSYFNKYALLTLQKDGEKCTKCRICLRACPMDIEEIYEEKGKTNISSKECIHCYRCVELCPEEDCLSVAFLVKKLYRSKSPYKRKSGGYFQRKSNKPDNDKEITKPQPLFNPPIKQPGGPKT